MNGTVPFSDAFLDQAYLGGDAMQSEWTASAVDALRKQYRERVSKITYEMKPIYDCMKEYAFLVSGKRGLVVGSETPWLEALLIEEGASKISTLEFGVIQSHHPQIETWTPDRFKLAFWEGIIAPFDFSFSFSSLEHDGLGRYGDVLNPIGDLQSMARLLSVVKPGGFLFLGVPCCQDRMLWNAHRTYGPRRLPVLLAGWSMVAYFPGQQPVLVLQNKISCRD